MDVRDKVVRAVKTDTPRNKATSLSSVRTKRAHKLSDDIRDKVLKAVEGGMTCRQAAAHCGVSLASAIRFAKRAGITDKRARLKGASINPIFLQRLATRKGHVWLLASCDCGLSGMSWRFCVQVSDFLASSGDSSSCGCKCGVGAAREEDKT